MIFYFAWLWDSISINNVRQYNLRQYKTVNLGLNRGSFKSNDTERQLFLKKNFYPATLKCITEYFTSYVSSMMKTNYNIFH